MQSDEADQVLKDLLNSSLYKCYVINQPHILAGKVDIIPKLRPFEEPKIKQRKTSIIWFKEWDELLMRLTKQYFDINWNFVITTMNHTYTSAHFSITDCKKRYNRLISGSVKFSSKEYSKCCLK